MVSQLVHRYPALQPYLKDVLVLEGCEQVRSAQSFRFFADGCPGIVFHQSEQGLLLNDQPYPVSSLFLYGQTLKPVHLAPGGRFRIVIFFLFPPAIRPLLGLRADELTDDCFDLGSLPTPSGVSLLEQLLRTDSVADQVEGIAAGLSRMLQRQPPPVDPALDYALRRIGTSRGAVPLRELQQTLRISERTFERRFEQYVGLSPRLYARICRFQATLTQLKNRHYDKLSDLAFDNGYADQSHFIRTFREFTGFSPLQFHRFPDPFTENRRFA